MTVERTDEATAVSPRRPLFGRLATASLFAACVLPFGFFRLTDSEPFPAMIFPGGAAHVPVIDGNASFYALSLLGVRSDGTLTQLDAAAFIDPLPSSYLDALVAQPFGQDASTETGLWIKGLNKWVGNIPRHAPSPDERRDARAWLAGRLSDAGLRTDRLIARREIITVDHDDRRMLGRETVDEVVIDLD